MYSGSRLEPRTASRWPFVGVRLAGSPPPRTRPCAAVAFSGFCDKKRDDPRWSRGPIKRASGSSPDDYESMTRRMSGLPRRRRRGLSFLS